MSPEWQFLTELNERLRPLTDPVEIQEVAVRSIGQHLDASRVNYAEIDGDEFIVCRSYASGVRPLAQRGAIAYFGKDIVDACRGGETVVVNDVRTDRRFTESERAQLLAGETSAFVAAPLLKDGQWLATFGVHCASSRIWTRDQIVVIELTAERAWAAGERARAEQALRRSGSRLTFLLHLNDTIRPLADPTRILEETCRLLGTHLQVNRVAYGEVEGDDCVIVSEYVDGLPSQPHRFPWPSMGGSRTADILKGGTLSVSDTSGAPHTAEECAALQAAGIGAYICPLLIKDGRLVGAFGIHSRSPRVWTGDEIALVQEVADRTWETVERRKAEANLRSNEERLAFLLRLNDALRPLSDPGAVQETAARLLGEHLGVGRVGYANLESSGFVIHREHTRGGVAPLSGRRAGISVGDTLRAALQRGETISVRDAETDPRLTEESRATLRSRQIAAFVGTALFKEGRMVAAFGANHNTPRAWTAAEIDLVRDVAARTWDAVERTRAEVEIREQKQRLRLALEASAGGSWTWVGATDAVDWDERFRALYGFTPDEPATPTGWLPRIHDEDRPQVVALLGEIMTSKTTDAWQHTFRIVRPDGTVAWIQSRGRAERDADGTVTRLTGLDLDFDEHRRVEEAQQLRRDEEHDRALRMLLETAAQGIVSVDARGIIVTANRAFETMFGWKPGELIGRAIECLLPSALRDAHARHRTSYFATPQPRLMGGGLNLVGERKDGSTFPVEISLNHVPTPAGPHVFAFVTDITERQRAALALQERTAELEYRTTQLSRMASDLTLAEQHAREEIAKTLHDGLQQMLVLVALKLEQQLKQDHAHAAAPRERLSEAKHHLDEAIEAARSLSFELYPPVLRLSGLPAALTWLGNRTQDKYKVSVEVVTDPHGDSPRKDIRTLLFESVRELLFNAVKHAQVDLVTVDLALDADDMLCITVEDRGIGFDPAGLVERGRAGHVGWGLFSIRERLTLLGGRFEIDSAVGRGSRFRLIAPRGSVPSGLGGSDRLQDVGSDPSSGGVPPRAPTRALRILIVDDHAGVRKVFRDLLEERSEFRVVGDASDGREAIAQAHSLLPDVILMDISMPHMDGIEATRRIRAELPFIEILGLSMQPQTRDSTIEQAGATAFFIKGTETQRLIDRLLVMHRTNTAGHPVS